MILILLGIVYFVFFIYISIHIGSYLVTKTPEVMPEAASIEPQLKEGLQVNMSANRL